MCKRLFCFWLGLFLLSFSVITANAEEGMCFSLENTEAFQNGIFETTLWSDSSVAAFVAHLEFDEDVLEFKDAKASNASAELSVNHTEGRLSLAYLLENGGKGGLITLSFKTKDGNASINLTVEQVIDSMGNKVSVYSAKGAEIVLTENPAKTNTNQSIEKSPTVPTQASIATTEDIPTSSVGTTHNYIYLPAKGSRDTTLIIAVAGGFTITLGIGVIAFILGRGTNKTNEKDKNEKDS